MAQVPISMYQPGVESGRVPLLAGEKRVRAVGRGERVSGQGVRRRGHRVHRYPRVCGMRHRLGEHHVRVRVDAPAAGVEAVQKGVHLAGVCIAQSGGSDGLLGPRHHR